MGLSKKEFREAFRQGRLICRSIGLWSDEYDHPRWWDWPTEIQVIVAEAGIGYEDFQVDHIGFPLAYLGRKGMMTSGIRNGTEKEAHNADGQD